MKMPHYLCTFFLLLFFDTFLPAQTARILTRQSTDSLFPDEKKKALDIKYAIWRAYQYDDKSGRYYIVLSERDVIVPGKDTLVTNIEGFCLQENSGQLSQKWKLKDAVDSAESSIWFWTKFSEVKDIDGDGYTDPLIIYGSNGKDEQADYHRLKILLYYKGNKIALRLATSGSGEQHSVQRDKAFSTLPPAIQSHIYTVLRHINKEQDYIWSFGTP